MYVVLTGAKQNVGDFLITERALALLRALRPETELVPLPAWQSLEPHLASVRRARAVIILGGPGFQRTFHPGVYKLVEPIERLQVPLIALGMGCKVFPGDDLSVRQYGFTRSSLAALRCMTSRFPVLGCRDQQAVTVLQRFGFESARLTGCPVWYDLGYLGKPFVAPTRVARVVFTPPQRSLYQNQSLRVASLLRRRFRGAQLIAAFHRGIDEGGEFMEAEEIRHNRTLARGLADMGYEVRNVARDVGKLAFYDECDLHVGYRVHAHVLFTSHRKPSVLLHEDGRGRAQTDTLGTPGLDAFERPAWQQTVAWLPVLGPRVAARGIRASATMEQRLDELLDREQARGYASGATAAAFIDREFATMRSFIEALP